VTSPRPSRRSSAAGTSTSSGSRRRRRRAPGRHAAGGGGDRRLRITASQIDLRLGAARAAALEVWQEQRRQVETARDELARSADKLTSTLN
jgi:hypothetical protein